MNTSTLSVLVENKPGVLARIARVETHKHVGGLGRAVVDDLRGDGRSRALGVAREAEIQAPRAEVGSGSTDAGDISWQVPMSQLSAATFVPGTPGHSWQSAACAGTSLGRKGMMVAAKTLALTAMDLFTDPAQVKAARESFDKRRAGFEYKSRVPADQKPPLNYRDK